MAKQEAVLSMSCYVVQTVNSRSMLYSEAVSHAWYSIVTHDGAAFGGVVLRLHGVCNL
jgi:hypothetical protein